MDQKQQTSQRQPTPQQSAAADMASVRDGARTNLAARLGELAAGPGGEAPDAREAAAALEGAIYDRSVRAMREAPRRAHVLTYAGILHATTAALAAPCGPYPDDVVGPALLAGRLPPAAAVAAGETPAQPSPRDETLRMLVAVLIGADPRYAAAREAALEAARAIEVSCYNAAVRASMASEEPPRRQWDSPAFVDLYSTRCGAVARLLDPASASCRAYGPTLVRRLLAGELAPGDLGAMSEKELCPQAHAAEREENARRSRQAVRQKESVLFRCPHCGERRSAYEQVQVRGSDEAPDYFCTCLNPLCKRRFKGVS
jgi:hypothetical protein